MVPLLSWLIIILSTMVAAQLVLYLTSFKLSLAAEGELDQLLNQETLVGRSLSHLLTLAGIDTKISDAVIAAAAILSAVIMALNLGLRAILGQIATSMLHRPPA